MKVVIDLLFDKIADKLIHTDARKGIGMTIRIFFGCHGKRTQLDFGLTFKCRFNNIDGNGCYKSVTDVL